MIRTGSEICIGQIEVKAFLSLNCKRNFHRFCFWGFPEHGTKGKKMKEKNKRRKE